MSSDLSKEQYQQLARGLKMDANPWITVAIVTLDVFLFSLALKWTEGGAIKFIFSQILIAVVALHNFALFHECVHGSAFRPTWMNTVLGHWCGLFCFLPYYSWRKIHREHHRWAGIVDKDPVLALINDYRPDRKYLNFVVKKTWRLWIPIAEFFQTLLYWAYPLVLIRKKKAGPKFFAQSVFSSAFLLGSYIFLFTYFPQTFNWKNFTVAWIIYLVLQEIISLPHHMGMPMYKFADKSTKLLFWEQAKIARTCYYPFPLGELLVLNFNFHIEHHLFPQLPWHRLRRTAHQVKTLLEQNYNEVAHVSWSMQNRKKDCTEVFYRPYQEHTSKSSL